jgi:hypothetical protein
MAKYISERDDSLNPNNRKLICVYVCQPGLAPVRAVQSRIVPMLIGHIGGRVHGAIVCAFQRTLQQLRVAEIVGKRDAQRVQVERPVAQSAADQGELDVVFGNKPPMPNVELVIAKSQMH